MSKNLPEAVVMSSNPDSPLVLDEPDFSGLMALTEASIRQKLSELKYPDSDFSSSQNEEDSDQKIISVAENQSIRQNQSEPQNDSETNGSSLHGSAIEHSASSKANIDPQISGSISNIEQPKNTTSGTNHTNMNTNAAEVGDSSSGMNLVSALEDPELVKLVSLSLKSNKPESVSEQTVKYCGLSVELPIENRSPELRKQPEKVDECHGESPTETSTAEPEESREKEMYVLEIHDDDDDKSPEPEIADETNENIAEKELPEENDADISDIDKRRTSPLEVFLSEENGGLKENNTKTLPQITTTHTAHHPESLEQESVINESDFEPESARSKGLTRNETSQDKVEKHSSPINELSDHNLQNVDGEEKVKDQSESVIGVVNDSQTIDTSAGKEISTVESVSKMTRSDLSNVCKRNEKGDTDEKIVKLNKSPGFPTTATVEKENKMTDEEEFQNLAAVSNPSVMEQIMSEDQGVDVDKGLAELSAAPGDGVETEQKTDDGDDVSENDLGLVISGVCSTAEVMQEGDIQTMQRNDAVAGDDKQYENDKEPVEEQQPEKFLNPSDEDMQPENTENDESELLDISDDIVMIDLDSHKSESDKNTRLNSYEKALVSASGAICPGINLKIASSDDKMIGLDSVNSNSDSKVSKVREESLSEDSVNTVARPMIIRDTEILNFPNDKITEKASDTVNEARTNQNSLESDGGSLSNVTIANVVSLDNSRIQDAAIISQTNTELSALESMLKKVTPREPEKDHYKSRSTPKTDSAVDNTLESNKASIVKQPENIKDNSKYGKNGNNKDQVVSEIPVTNVEKASSGQSKDKNSDDRLKINEQSGDAKKDKDKVESNEPNTSPPITSSENLKTGEKSVTENNSLTDVSEMLMITNVRTISLDEEEKLTEEGTKDNDDQMAQASDALTDKQSAAASSMDNTSGLEETVLNEQTGTFELQPVRTTSAENLTNIRQEAKKSDQASVSSSASTPVSPTAGMPVIANTFTIKEEPMDYEPYGMPNTVASRAKQAVNSQPRNSTEISKRLGFPVEISTKQGNSHLRRQSGGEQSYQGKDMVRHGTMIHVNAPNRLMQIKDPTRISNGEAFNRQKSPVTVQRPAAHNVVRPAANKAHSYLVNKKAIPQPSVVSKPLVSGTSQVLKNHSNGVISQSLRGYPSVSSVTGQALSKPAPVPIQPQPPSAPPKFAMNLKTINIETVGIPMITEMIARKNPVPVYKPPPPPKSVLGDEKTKQTFQCYECGDTFYFTSSLEQHTYRCSMKISYKCEWCRKILDFTNKCQLLSHLRSHMNIDKNQAVPIHIKSDSIEIRTNFDDIIPGKEFKWYNIPEKENLDDIQEAQFLIDATNNGLPSQIIRLCRAHECTECRLTFYKKDDRAKMIHFALDKNVKPIFCGKCPMYLHNHCGIKAHRRLHEDITKLDFLVCPECGICYEGKPESIPIFLKHLKTKCFHLSRFSTLTCKKCSGSCTSIEELRHHLTTQVEQYYKCNKCPMALKTLKSFNQHFKQVHEQKAGKDDSAHEAKAKIIYRCHVCDTLIDDKEFLLSHIEKHLSELKDQAKEYYHCLQCGLIFFEQKNLINHYKGHRQTTSEAYCTLCRTQRRDLVEYTQHILAQHIAPIFKLNAKICELCGLVCVDEHKLRIHECHMKTFAFVVQGDKSAATSQKEHKTKSPRKEGKEVENKEEKDKTRDKHEEIPTDDDRKSTKDTDRNDKDKKSSPHKRSQVKSENLTSKYRSIQPKPSSKDDAIPSQYKLQCPKPLNKDDAIPSQYKLQCPSCGDRYSSNFRRVEHLRNHKTDKIFICPYCEDLNFDNEDDLEYHEKDCSKEFNSDFENPIPKHLSKKCPSCSYVYGGKNKRNFHIKAHRGDKVFICLYCDAMNFANYPELRSHEVVCSALNKTTVKNTSKSPSTNKIKLKISKGKPSKTSSPNQPTQYQIEFKCDDCGQCFSRKEKQEEHTRLEHGIHPCHLCGLMYESQTSLKKHLLISHEGKKCVYYCWVCKRRRKFFSDVSHLHKHFSMKHKYRVWDPAKAVAELPGMATPDINKPPPPPAKRRIETTPEIQDTPVKKLRIMSDKGFKCAKCSFVSEERKDFEAHIKEHKMDGSVQCIECGLSFTVIPSLKKHLFMVHKVRDFDTYLKEHNMEDLQEPEESDSENESNNSKESEELIVDEPIKAESPAEESEEEEGNPLECRVCYKKFETEHLMKSHMRVHGMAFIKKTRRSLSSAAKKQKLDTSEGQGESERVKSVEKQAKSVE